MGEKLYFNNIKEHRGAYLLEYQPPYPGNSIATLQLTFLDDVQGEDYEEILGAEALAWLMRYPVPLMATAWDNKGDMILNSRTGSAYLIGWIGPGKNPEITFWEPNVLDDKAIEATCPSDLRGVYKDIQFRTETDVKNTVDQKYSVIGRENRILKIILVLWLAAIPFGYALFEFFGPEWLGLLALGVALWNAVKASLQIWGRWPESEQEKKEKEKEIRMAHYFYHCERNPEGFQKLKVENFKKDEKIEIQKEAERLQKNKTRG